MADQKYEPFISVNLTPAMSGYFATHWHWNLDDPKYPFPEPWTSGIGRYATWQEANVEGAQWAEAEGLKFIPATAEDVAKAEAYAANFRKRADRRRDLVATGMKPAEAWAQAKQEFPEEK